MQTTPPPVDETSTGACPHDFERPLRAGRAHYLCRQCGADISLALFLMWEAMDPLDVSIAQKHNM